MGHCWTSNTAFRLIAVLLGVVLLIAASLKGHQLLTGNSTQNSFLNSRTVQILIVESELIFGLWLVTGLYRRASRWVGLLYFPILAGFSGYMVIVGSDCCSCFGRYAVHPWFSFSFNLVAIVLLACVAPSSTVLDGATWMPVRSLLAVGVLVFLSVFLYASLPGYQLATTAHEDTQGDGSVIVLDLESWTGKTLPVLESIDIGEKLKHGQWVIMLYHADCPQCYDVMKQLVQAYPPTAVKMALIEVPMLSGLPNGPRWAVSQRVVIGQMSIAKRWSVKTPAVLKLKDGVVVSVQTKF